MGSGGSKPRHVIVDPTIPVMPTLAPYPGPKVQYFFLVVNASMKTKESEMMDVQTSDTDRYFPSLANMYQSGYRLSLNACQPVFTEMDVTMYDGVRWVSSRSTKAKYMGIFRTAFPDELNNPVQLRMVNATIKHKTDDASQPVFEFNETCLTSGVSDCKELFNTIGKVTSEGGRIVCLEYSGMGKQRVQVYKESYQPPGDYESREYHDSNAPELDLIVNVYYETPVNPSDEKYNYEFVTCPFVVVGSDSYTSNRRTVSLDWQTACKPYMDTGWKLVDIFEDMTATVSGSRGQSLTQGYLWVFEKPASKMNESFPVYELKMAELWFEVHKNATNWNNVATQFVDKTDIAPLLNHMGTEGWEVVRFLETTERWFKTKGVRAIFTKNMIFFQRRIEHREGSEATGETINSDDLPLKPNE